MTAAEKTLRDLLAYMRDESRAHFRGYHYAGAADFVLQHGTWYDPGPVPVPERGPARACFGNAISLALKRPGLVYVEGYALAHDLAHDPILHAWNATGDGQLADITWLNHGYAYLGCTFSIERADDATWYGDGCVLMDAQRDYPIFRAPWTGEQPIPHYRPSPALRRAHRLARRGRLLPLEQHR